MNNRATIYDLYRMCNSMIDCKGCMLHSYNIECSFLEHLSKKEISEINENIIEWCKTHPPKSYKEDFLEKFPNAELEEVMDDKVPTVCRNKVYKNCSCHKTEGKSSFEHTPIFVGDCIKCWNTPMEE